MPHGALDPQRTGRGAHGTRWIPYARRTGRMRPGLGDPEPPGPAVYSTYQGIASCENGTGMTLGVVAESWGVETCPGVATCADRPCFAYPHVVSFVLVSGRFS